MVAREPAPFATPAARQAERRAVVGTLAAELAHEIQGPLNLFRSTIELLERGQPLDQEDVALLREELERLTKLGARLRELGRRPAKKEPCSPRELVERALIAGGFSGQVELEVQSDEPLECDAGLVELALRELLDNAFAAKTRRLGVRVGSAGFCVWDDGGGLPLPLAAAVDWGGTTRTNAAGLGLAVAMRAARAHGFELDLRRENDLTECWLRIPQRPRTPQVIK
jgi:signal transduction histidine kinase